MNNSLLLNSTFEILPCEIFFELFDYLLIQQLYACFYNLNYHLTSILSSYTNIPAKLANGKDMNYSAIYFFSPNITRLSLNYHYSIDLSSFQSLRSIKILDKPNRFQYYSFKFLVNLELICIVHNTHWNNNGLIQLSNDIMTNSFPRLRFCQIGQIKYDHRLRWNYLLSLRSLIICTREPDLYPEILHYCPNLIRIKLIIDFLTKPGLSQHSPHLFLQKFEICLALRSTSLCEILEYLLYFTPNLTHFILNGPIHYSKQQDINLLSFILHKYVSKLTQFYFQMAIDNTLAVKLLQEDFTNISQLHPLFNQIKIHRKTSNSPAKIIIKSCLCI